MKDELVKILENQVAVKLDDDCWKGLQELYKYIDELQRTVETMKEINESHHRYNAELMGKVDKLVADKMCLQNRLNKIKEFNSYDECGEFKEEEDG